MSSSSKTKLLRIAIIILVIASFIGGFKLITKSRFLGSSDFNQAQESVNKAIQIRKEAALMPIDADNAELQSTGLKFKSKEDAVKYANLKAESDRLAELSVEQAKDAVNAFFNQLLIIFCVALCITLIILIIGKLVDCHQSK